MKSIPLTQGKSTIVDDADFEALSTQSWHASLIKKYYYAKAGSHGEYMHRQILGAPTAAHVDHINGDTLDNRRVNPRICTRRENCMNTGLSKANKSGVKGVHWRKSEGKWAARIGVNKKTISLGCHNTIEEARRAYDDAARKYFGAFARTNDEIITTETLKAA